ncbi:MULTISPECIES: dihydrodipicolinate synthase family protein [Pseudomonas]|uniref:dihydrodipicolinate synthase family protein n=1 Tax=Pseudomonas TaxID=286 RepID=UPI001C2F5066|nr:MULTISPECIES: dihydrodipicolinate synthase family protein [Pseudomonas]MBV2079637.1 dihydrodipicolinate synthase family protein [Pseudomonas carnis]MBV2085391.1 dihydrodipicolinate synthase family protein [Pseudomonas carnis]MDO3689365.1 dihydrodipicolinate synthase family protein [Pseudomonas sp. DKN 2791]MDO7031250.1 dihydrodipicolinate synthase family protein [Pseudomonas sp. DKN 2792]
MSTNFLNGGHIPACLLPFNDDLSIDEVSLRAHLSDVASVDGVVAITVNGHASEVASCSFEEQQRVLQIAVDEIGIQTPVVNGLYTESGLQAMKIAKMSRESGAQAMLVFPPGVISIGQRPEMLLDFFKRIEDASDGLPIILYQFPVKSNLAYPLSTLMELVEKVPSIRAVKDNCGDPQLHERQIRLLHAQKNPVTMFTTQSAWLMASLAIGADGLLSGMGSVAADLQVNMYNAIKANDLKKAKEIQEFMFPLTEVFYSDPWTDMHNRMKEALVMLGKLPRAVVRPPLMKVSDADLERIRSALVSAGLLA